MEPIGSNIIFKEIITKSELLACLKLRFEVYQHSRVAAWTYKHRDQLLEIDGFDINSRHYAAINTLINQPVAYMRVVQGTTGALAKEVKEIAAEYNIPVVIPSMPVPVMEYFPEASSIISRIIVLNSFPLNICEPGRFSVRCGNRSLSITKSFVHFVLNQNWNNYKLAVLSCVKTHVPFYSIYGFKIAENTKAVKVHKDLPEVCLLMKRIGRQE